MRETPQFLFLDSQQWSLTLFGATLVAVIFMPFYGHISSWIGAGFFIATIAFIHMARTSRYCLPLPQLAVVSSTIYYIFAPLVALYFPSQFELYNLHQDPALYFEFAVPAVLATSCGWMAGFWNLKPMTIPKVDIREYERLRYVLDTFIVIGIIVSVVLLVKQPPESIAFVLLLIAYLRFVGIMGWVITLKPGWKWRLVALSIFEIFSSSMTGFLLDLILWAVAIVALVFQRFRVPGHRIFFLALLGVVMLPCVQHAKWKFRDVAWMGGKEDVHVLGMDIAVSRYTKPVILPLMVSESLANMLTMNVEPSFFRDTVVRYNQSWIVERVMITVPSRVPFANGETVKRAIIDSFIPRALFPNKTTAGGKDNFPKYTGVILNARTSMSLGFVGEMYANFGYAYGIVGCGGYGLVLGLIFRWLISRTEQNHLMVAFVPYVLHWAVLSESGLFEIANYTIKALVVTLVFSRFLMRPTRAKQPVNTGHLDRLSRRVASSI